MLLRKLTIRIKNGIEISIILIMMMTMMVKRTIDKTMKFFFEYLETEVAGRSTILGRIF